MIQLRPYQSAAIEAIYGYFAENAGNPLIVLPTGTGKGLVIASFSARAIADWPDTRILIVTHVKELIAQNHAEMLRLWPEAPAGIYSAGLNKRDLHAQILFAGIQSIHKRAYDIQRCDLVLIDEAHLIPRTSNTMYRRFLGDLAVINPTLKIIGFTATPYRLDSGMLHEGDGALFTDIAYEAGVAEMIAQGYLCEVVPKRTRTQLDTAGVGSRGGEFIAGQLEAAVDIAEVTASAVDEIVHHGAGRGSWLVFCAGVDHAHHVRDAIRSRGVPCEAILGETASAERDRVIAAYKRGEIRCLTNANVLTTGFNAPGVDLIAMLRPTKSVGLYVQMIGRGTRLANGKDNCLVLDFAGNVERHGPIDRIDGRRAREGRRRRDGPGQDLPGLPDDRPCGRSRMPTMRPRVPPAAARPGAQRLDERHPVQPGRRPVGDRHRRHLSPPREARRPAQPARRVPLRLRLPSRMGLLRAHRLRPAEGGALVAEAAARRSRTRHRRGSAPPRCRAAGAGAHPRPPAGPLHRDHSLRVRAMLCDVCRREARGFGWYDVRWPIDSARPDRRLRQLCSRTCQDICHRRRGMIDPTPNEKAAFVHGGAMGGEYLDSIARTDLATLSPDEWLTFVEAVVTGYCDHLRALAERDAEHLRKLDPEVPI